MEVQPSVHPSPCWAILRWGSFSSSPVSLVQHFIDLSRLGTFSYLPCSVNWMRTDLVFLSCTSELPVVIFSHWVSTGVTPSWWIQILPSVFKFFILYHHCITHRLMIIDVMLCWPIFSLDCLISPWMFDQCTLNCFFLLQPSFTMNSSRLEDPKIF